MSYYPESYYPGGSVFRFYNFEKRIRFLQITNIQCTCVHSMPKIQLCYFWATILLFLRLIYSQVSHMCARQAPTFVQSKGCANLQLSSPNNIHTNFTLCGVCSVVMFYFLFLSFWSSGYQLGCTVAAISAKWPMEHFKNASQSIMTEWTPSSVQYWAKRSRLGCVNSPRG